MKKALLIQTNSNMDMSDVLQIAKTEGSKLFRKPNRIKVLDILRSPYGLVAVVQKLNGCSQHETDRK